MKKVPWTVGRQLGAAFGVIVVLVLLLALTAWSRIAAMNRDFDALVDQTLPALTALSDVNDRLQVVRTAELSHLAALTMPAKDREEASVKATVKSLDEALVRYRAAAANLSDENSNAALAAAISQFHAARSTFLQMSNSAAGAESERAVEASDYFTGPSQQAYKGAYDAVQTQWKMHLDQADAAKAAGRVSAVKANTMLLAVTVVCAGLSVMLAVFITRALLRQLGGQPAYVAQLARTIADANLASPVAVRSGDTDSVVAAMARMQESLTRIVHAVRQGADSVAIASAEIAQGNHDLSSRTEHQASALEETASSMEDLNAKVRQNALSAGHANQLALNASTVAVQGGNVVSQVVQTMKGINEASRKIEDIIQVIDGIAFQTNILALNAAVEAARAGEQGRGFAVVASEVRSLAGRSAEAAKEIKQLIGTSVQRVEQGCALVDQAGHTMTEVVAAIRKVTDIVGEISTASSDQSAGVSQIGEAVNEMDQVTQQNAALVEEMAAAASSLQSQASALVRVVAVFQTAGESGDTSDAVLSLSKQELLAQEA
ncbi:methyl-accepting chemotaxis protein [Rhodoferax mekongensis]|uniref:Methyl-accepting chemotaxis protein n=1 Tax=Rhodoferax mekongensis TaxID=3068341 RepID=A0ABZ0AV02_9BURK|nr:methyl-accepting chemotaxis protein [Rhodoferax sp. TBRC 17307]WNO03449.1 methyl-accepting chemotaxis protein [Rhodoferax sp. TBRC 17307]